MAKFATVHYKAKLAAPERIGDLVLSPEEWPFEADRNCTWRAVGGPYTWTYTKMTGIWLIKNGVVLPRTIRD